MAFDNRIRIAVVSWLLLICVNIACDKKAAGGYEINVPSKDRLGQIQQEERELGQQIRGGNSKGAWRLAAYRLFSSDENDISESCLILIELIYGRPDLVPAVASILESRLIHSGDIGLSGRQELFQTYIAIEKIPFSFPDTQKALDEAFGCLSSREMSDSSIKLAERLIRDSSIEKKVAASSILIIASQLGGKDKEWAERLCRGQLPSKSSRKQQVLGLMYETITGKFQVEKP